MTGYKTTLAGKRLTLKPPPLPEVKSLDYELTYSGDLQWVSSDYNTGMWLPIRPERVCL